MSASAPVLTFFNNKDGVGKTSLVYHLAWMFADMGCRVAVFDLDPQANLTGYFFSEDDIEKIWEKREKGTTIYHCVRPLTQVSDVAEPVLKPISENLFLLPGDVELSGFEENLSENWIQSVKRYSSLRVETAFWYVMQTAAQQIQADIILVDVGPNLGAINRSVLLATDYVAIPLGADLFSLQGLSNLGSALAKWRKDWQERVSKWPESDDYQDFPNFHLPEGRMEPIGYLCQQYGVRLDRPVKAYDKWVNRIPSTYREKVLNDPSQQKLKPENDPYCLATIKHYRSLVPMGQEHRKPIFHLTSADGAIGSHANAVQAARNDFKILAEKIAQRINLQWFRVQLTHKAPEP